MGPPSSVPRSPPSSCERVQHRQVVDALGDVVAGRLAELLVGGDDVEDVVDDLEGHAVVPPELGELVDVLAGQLADDPADAARGGEERRGLALDGDEVRLDRAAGVVGVPQLVDLALAQLADRGGQEPGDLGAEAGGDLGRLGQQEVAGEDRLEVAPAQVDALDPAARLRLVDHVVVAERAHLHELHRDATEDHVVGHRRVDRGRVAGQGGRRGDGEQGPSPLPAGGDQVAAHLGHQLVFRRDHPQEGLLDPGPVPGHPGELVQRALGDHGEDARGSRPRCRKQGISAHAQP